MSRPGNALRLGRYRLIERLGRGGMAEVWRAQADGQPMVAVKRILPHLYEHPGVIELFEREAASSALLHHSNIVQVVELVAAGGEYLLVMELVAGSDLSALLKSGPLPIGCALEVSLALCRALAHAHTLIGPDGKPLALLHRDVSPSNVLVGKDGAIKLSDFGVAKIQAHVSAVTQSKVRGKSSYMSPEQAAGERIDARSDLFSLGVVIYEMTTGTRPFDSVLGALSLRTGSQAPPPSTKNSALPPELDAIVMRLLEADPDARFANAEAVALELAPLAHRHLWAPNDTALLVAAVAPTVKGGDPTPATATATTPPRRLPFIALAALITIVVAALALWPRRSTLSPPPAPPTPSPVRIVIAVAPPAASPSPHPEIRKRPPRKKPRTNLRDVEVRDPFER